MNATTQEEDKKVAENTNLDVVVQMMNVPCEGSISNSTTSSPKENRKVATLLIRNSQIKKSPYRHPNRRSRQLDQATYPKQKQQVDVLKNTNVSAIYSCDNSSQVSSYHKIP